MSIVNWADGVEVPLDGFDGILRRVFFYMVRGLEVMSSLQVEWFLMKISKFCCGN
jgi:hypothetical protein